MSPTTVRPPTEPNPSTVPPSAAVRPVGALRGTLCAVTIAACGPYLLLKAAWLAGSRLGIPADSVLHTDSAVLYAVNALTVLMDALVIVLALALVRAWGRRLPAPLLLLPLWGATGLLAPILVAGPAQAVLALAAPDRGRAGDEPVFLEGWVAPVVYSGFTVQGLALGTLLVLYLKDRWGDRLRGRVAELPTAGPDRALRAAAGLALALATVPTAVHLWGAAGTGAGLGPDAAEWDAAQRLAEAVHAGFGLAAAAALLLLVFRVAPRVRLRTAAGLAWLGGSVLCCWGLWWLLMGLTSELPGGGDVTRVQWLTYSAQVISGLLVLAVSVRLAQRHRAPARAARGG